MKLLAKLFFGGAVCGRVFVTYSGFPVTVTGTGNQLVDGIARQSLPLLGSDHSFICSGAVFPF